MCHFYANPLSVLLTLPSVDAESFGMLLTHTHLDAIRNLPSMRQYIQGKLDANDTSEAKSLLLNDAYLASLLPQLVDFLQKKSQELRSAVLVLAKLSEKGITKRSLADIYL